MTAREQQPNLGEAMTRGMVTRVVKSFGSNWGYLRPRDETREIFFNAASFPDLETSASIAVGQEVEFDESPDRTNGSRADRIVVIAP